MQYSNIEKLGAKPSRLGFGCMRLPTTPEGAIDEPRAAAMIDRAIKAGVNYFDTAFFYHKRQSEAFVGKTLKKYPRESFYLATKLPLSLIHSLEEAKEIYAGQFATLQVDYVDFYLLHAINGKRWREMRDNGVVDFLLKEQKAGRIRYLGFSFHDDYAAFEEIITARDWDFCQLQFNYMDIDTQAGMKGYELATKLGVPVIVMEPVKGGSLATLSDDVAELMRAERPDKSLASWAMRWVGSLDNCRVILSGMTTEEQVEDNLATFEHFEPLSEREQEIIAKTRDAIRAKQFIGCTNCRYCMPCPFGVAIPRNFSMMNAFAMYGNEKRLQGWWQEAAEEERASACKQCGKCETVCPQGLAIRDKLAEIAQRMA